MTSASQPAPHDAMVSALFEIRAYATAIPGTPSALGDMLAALATGVLGDGCSAHYRAPDAHQYRMPVRPAACDRYAALRDRPGHAVRAWLLTAPVSEERRAHPLRLSDAGHVLSAGERGKAREIPVSLEQACAWALAPAETRAKWTRKLLTTDRRAALDRMTEVGAELLRVAAVEWEGER